MAEGKGFAVFTAGTRQKWGVGRAGRIDVPQINDYTAPVIAPRNMEVALVDPRLSTPAGRS